MFQAIENENYYYLTFEMTQENIEKYAQEQEYEMKLLGKSIKLTFNQQQKKLFEPFRTKDICNIYLSIINSVIAVDELYRQKALV